MLVALLLSTCPAVVDPVVALEFVPLVNAETGIIGTGPIDSDNQVRAVGFVVGGGGVVVVVVVEDTVVTQVRPGGTLLQSQLSIVKVDEGQNCWRGQKFETRLRALTKQLVSTIS
jgi:hypothetical protein